LLKAGSLLFDSVTSRIGPNRIERVIESGL
jgi:hypothetical protein